MATNYQDPQQEDLFEGEDIERFPFFQWLNGQQVYNDPESPEVSGVASGWHIKANEDETDELNLCLRALCDRWDQEVIAAKKAGRKPDYSLHCREVYVKFQGQRSKPGKFYHLKYLTVFPLAYRVPNNRQAIWYNPSERRGIAAYWETPLNFETRMPEDEAIPYVKLLVVSKALTEANYIDSNGQPRPIMLTSKKSSANFLYNNLLKQMEVVRVARTNGVDPGVAQFYNYAMTLYAGDERIEVGTVKKSYQYPMISTTPAKQNLTFDFTLATFAGDELVPHLAALAEVGREWSRARIDAAIRNQLRYSNKPELTEKLQFSDGSPAKQDGSAPATSAATAIAEIDAKKKQVLESLVRNFNKVNEPDTAAAIKRVLEQSLFTTEVDGKTMTYYGDDAAGKAIAHYGGIYRQMVEDPYK